ncbi:MAG TPA: hypothetical protein VNR18_12945 [Hyphomicrobiales bacterium]|nr:hypothetical protein [Hyphomicrobiales bacterium]
MHQQRGTVLLIVLVALTLLFSLVAAGLERAMLQTHMVDNQLQHQLALAAAESAATSASIWLSHQTQRPLAAAGNTQGLWTSTTLAALAPGQPWWQNVDAAWWQANAHTLTGAPEAAQPPRYVIEERLVQLLEPPTPTTTPVTVVVYRITAHGNGTTPRSEAQVQRYYTKTYE